MTLQPFPRELIVSWIPADDNILIKGYKLGYGTITPDAHWVDIESHLRLTTLTNLRKYYLISAAGLSSELLEATWHGLVVLPVTAAALGLI